MARRRESCSRFRRRHGWGERALLLAAAHVEGARSLFSLFDLKLHPLPFSQTIEIKVLQARAVEKHLLAFGAADETKPAVPNDPFDRTLHVSLDSRKRRVACGLVQRKPDNAKTSHSSATFELYQHLADLSKRGLHRDSGKPWWIPRSD